MKRKDFLKTLGATGIGLSIPFERTVGKLSSTAFSPPPVCELVPTETAGPFPLDLTENSFYLRQDITEGEEGIQLNLKMKIFGVDNCQPMTNVRVNIWHCTKDGLYSGYSTNNNQGQGNFTYLRGYQYTDANGEVDFTTIFPGWYNGRICHIHFQVYVNSSYSAISQLTFPLDAKNDLYVNNSSLYTKGEDPKTFATDNIFSDGYEYQLASLEANADGNGYDSYLEVGVQGEGTVGVSNIEKETAKVFELGQNFPNPYRGSTSIPFTIHESSDVTLTLWDLQGRKIRTVINNEKRSIGNHQVDLNDLGSQSFIYELEARNSKGVFKYSKMMTAM